MLQGQGFVLFAITIPMLEEFLAHSMPSVNVYLNRLMHHEISIMKMISKIRKLILKMVK